MSTYKRVLAVVAIVLAAIGLIVGLLGIWFSWAYNTPLTEALTRYAEGAERVLTAADVALERVDRGVGVALGATRTVDEAARSAGQTVVETNLAFLVLERAVGETLFPRVLAAAETARAAADTIIAFNQTLESLNNLPFIEVPTLSTELQSVAERLEAARARVEEIQTAVRDIKERKVARPVAFFTDRTGPIIDNLDQAQTAIQSAMARIDVVLPQLAALRARLPRLIDTASILITLVLLWLIAVQAYALIRAYEYLSGKRIDWQGLARRLRRAEREVTVQ